MGPTLRGMPDANPPALDLVAKLGAVTNLTHGFIYFAPEATEEYRNLGLLDEQHYFASRGAAFGPVPAEVVIATFFNFCPDVVRVALPDAWDVASPRDIQSARMRAAARTLERCCPDVDREAVEEAGLLAARMIDGVGFQGTALAGANRAVPEPDDPLGRLWQRITVIREWRGDIHVAVLTAAGLDAVEALILHAATEQVPRAALLATRGWPASDWQAGVDSLVARGLVHADESFTDAGRAFREELETRTNVVCARMVAAAGEADTRRFLDLLKPVRKGLLESGIFAGIGR